VTSSAGSADPAARFAEVEQALLARTPESLIAPDLTRMRLLTELLGDPQDTSPVIHLTGTNGKTSTARMVETLIRAFDLSTGLYTSPHLHSMTERIRLNGESIDPARFVESYDEIAPYLELVDERSEEIGGPPMSFFEAITGLAFGVFSDAPVDVSVIEVGMGGRWDATNVADAQVAAILPVGLDHAEYLGDTVELIAAEKAGIIKPGATAVIAEQPLEAMEVLLAHCEQFEAKVWREGIDFAVVRRDVAVGGQRIALQGLGGLYDEIDLPLFGEHQARNAAVALATVESFFGGGTRGLDPERVRAGFAAVTSPGRLEIVRSSPTVIIDAAHNPHGAQALSAALQESFAFSYLIGVLAVLEDKDALGLLRALEPVFAEVVVSENHSPRAMPVDDLADLAFSVFGEDRVRVARTMSDAIDVAVGVADLTAAGEGGTGVVVTGSVVTAAQARGLLGGLR